MIFLKLTMRVGLLMFGLFGDVWADKISFHLKSYEHQNANANMLEQEEQLFIDMHMEHAGHLLRQELGSVEETFKETLQKSFSKTRISFEHGNMYLVVAQDAANNLLGSIFFCLADINGELAIRIRHFNARNFDDHADLTMLFKGMLPYIQSTFSQIKSMICVSHKLVKVYDEGLKAIGFECIDFIPEGCSAEHQQTYQYKLDVAS